MTKITIRLTENELEGLFNNNDKWEVKDLTKITRYHMESESHPLFKELDYNQTNNIVSIEKFDNWYSLELEKNHSYKQIENYFDFLSFKYGIIKNPLSIFSKEENEQDVFIKAIRDFPLGKYEEPEYPPLSVIDYYISCTYENKEGIKYIDTLHMKIINRKRY